MESGLSVTDGFNACQLLYCRYVLFPFLSYAMYSIMHHPSCILHPGSALGHLQKMVKGICFVLHLPGCMGEAPPPLPPHCQMAEAGVMEEYYDNTIISSRNLALKPEKFS